MNLAKDVIKKFEDGRIKYYRMNKNSGSSVARNYGFNKSNGMFIVFLDDDNEFLPNFLKETAYLLRTSVAEVGGVRVGRIIVQKDYKDYASPITHTGFDSIDWGFLMKRKVMQNIKYDINIFGDEDADFGIEFAKQYQQIPIDKALQIAYANDEDSVCKPTPKRLQGLEYFLNKHLEHYKKHPNELRYIYRLAGRNFYKAGYKLKGLKYFWKSFLAKPNFKTFKHLFFILFGWNIYDKFMTRYEKIAAKKNYVK